MAQVSFAGAFYGGEGGGMNAPFPFVTLTDPLGELDIPIDIVSLVSIIWKVRAWSVVITQGVPGAPPPLTYAFEYDGITELDIPVNGSRWIDGVATDPIGLNVAVDALGNWAVNGTLLNNGNPDFVFASLPLIGATATTLSFEAGEVTAEATATDFWPYDP